MSEGLLPIGEIARRCGVSCDTIRHYERKGVITDVVRDESGYRRFSATTVHRVLVVRRAISIGFTLDELSRIFKQRRAGQPPCKQVRGLASDKLLAIDRQLEELKTVRAALVGIIASWDEKLESSSAGQMAHLLDSLIEQTEEA